MMIEISLKEKDILQLLKLEQLFHSQYLTEELLNELISLYVQFVEGIHHNHHPLRLYFMEKIRFVLSRPEVIKILEKQSQARNLSIRETVRGVMGINEQEEIQLKKMAEQAKEEVRQHHLINRKDQNNGHLREKERAMKIEMQLAIMQEVEANVNTLRKDLSQQHTKQLKQLDQVVSQQDQSLQQRRANRKKKLRKKSADLTEKENLPVIEEPPIAKEELKKIQAEVNQTFERFTRLTENRMKLERERKENEGRVKFHAQHLISQEEQLFDQEPQKKEAQPVANFSKKKPQNKVVGGIEPKDPATANANFRGTQQKQGRVTVRQVQQEAVQEQQFS